MTTSALRDAPLRAHLRYTIASTVLAIAAALGGITDAGAITLSETAAFSVSGQPIWSGAAPVFEKVLAQTTVGPQLQGLPSVLDFGIVGKYGVGVDFALGINLGLNTRLREFHQGVIDVNFPVHYMLNVPDAVKPGETFTISSSFVVDPNAHFTASTQDAELDIGAKSGLVARLGVDVCAFNCFLSKTGNGSLVNVNQPFGTLDLITKTADSTIVNVNVPGYGMPTFAGEVISLPDVIDVLRPIESAVAEVTNVSGDLGVPMHEVTGALSGAGVLSSADTDIFTNVQIDLDGFTPLGKFLGNTVQIGDLKVGYEILDASLVTQLIERQALEFAGNPTILVDAGPLGVHEMPLGGSLDLVMPQGVGTLLFETSLQLDNTLSNETTVAAMQAFEVTAGQLLLQWPSVTLVPGIPAVIVDPPEVCIPFVGCYDPPPFELTPAVPPVIFPGVNFDETAFATSFTDDILAAVPGALTGDVSLDTCVVAPQVCDALPLIGGGGPDAAQLFASTFSLDFGTLAGPSFAINAIPLPGGLLLLASALGLCGLVTTARPLRPPRR